MSDALDTFRPPSDPTSVGTSAPSLGYATDPSGQALATNPAGAPGGSSGTTDAADRVRAADAADSAEAAGSADAT
ncbi:hypothetical protein CCO02nite_03420 [Cellulomonas composti]|uniref:Uncharacterized protein n=1 Tax=Cellulomonas composti TaxID=266130 RepID=A0A511J6S6_9CELL|nr:hypothetical protein CCO02nite_03420 [Cellulomonas composti]